MIKFSSSYSKKSLVLMLLVGVVPVIFIGTILYYDKINSETNALEQRLTSLSQIGSNNIHRWIDEKITSLESIANNDLFVSNVKKLSHFSADSKSSFDARYVLEKETNSAMYDFEWIDELIIYDVAGNVIFYTDLQPPIVEHQNNSYFFNSINGQSSIGQIIPSTEPLFLDDGNYATGVPTMFVSVPINGDVGIEGILVARINLSNIASGFTDPLYGIEEFESYIINSEGIVVSPSPNHAFYSNFLEDTLSDNSLQNDLTLLFDRAKNNGHAHTLKGYDHHDGKKVLGSIYQIPNTDWFYVLEIDKNSAFQSINYLQIILISTISLIVIAIVWISTLFSSSLSTPIIKIQEAAKKISTGEREFIVPSSGDKEIVDLGKSLNNMLKSLLDSEHKIRNAEKKYRSLYEDAPEMYRTVDNDGKLVNCNKAYCEKLGYSKEEIIGKSLFDFVPDSHKESMNEIFSSWKRMGDVRNREIILKRKDGTVFPALLSATSVMDDGGNVIGANTLIRDMSDLYNAQKEIEELRLKRLSVVGELTARIAHDLRNPLSVIKNSVEILRLTYEEKTDSSQKEQWERLERGIYRITHQVDDVLDYIRAPPLKIEENSLSVIIQDTIERIQIPDSINIHPPTNDVIIPCDAEKLEVVFVNLIMNAIQAFEGKAGDVTINIEDNYDNGKSVLVQVIDNGPGIPNELIEKIFDPLFTTRQIGTGLGLPSCKNIVERHEGKITVSTDSNQGTTFSVILPKQNEKFLTSEI